MKETNVGLGETFIDIPAGSQENFLSIKPQILLCKKTTDGLLTSRPSNSTICRFVPSSTWLHNILEEKTFVVFPLLFRGRGISSPGDGRSWGRCVYNLLVSKSLRKKITQTNRWQSFSLGTPHKPDAALLSVMLAAQQTGSVNWR